MTPLETLPQDCQNRIADLTERRAHCDTMVFSAADAHELAAWELYLDEIELAGIRRSLAR